MMIDKARNHPPSSTAVMSQYFDSLDEKGRRACINRLWQELDGLWEIGVRSESSKKETGNWLACLNVLSQLISNRICSDAYRYDYDTTCALVESLTYNTENPIEGMVNDLAEILFIDRKNRTEYITSRQIALPYKINKLLLEYAIKARRVDDLLGELNKGFCAHECPQPPVGCCYLLGYDLGMIPEKMLSVQRLEAERKGWREPPNPDLRKCRYHSNMGCSLALFKSPACIGFMCSGIDFDLSKRYEPIPLSRFNEKLLVFRNCDIDREKVFWALDELLDAGKALLESPANL